MRGCPGDVTDTELAMLYVLWQLRRATRRQIADALEPQERKARPLPASASASVTWRKHTRMIRPAVRVRDRPLVRLFLAGKTLCLRRSEGGSYDPVSLSELSHKLARFRGSDAAAGKVPALPENDTGAERSRCPLTARERPAPVGAGSHWECGRTFPGFPALALAASLTHARSSP
jgi:hypothetical protein